MTFLKISTVECFHCKYLNILKITRYMVYNMLYVLLPQNKTPRALGRPLIFERTKKFIQAMQKDSVKLFQHRFVLCPIMIL